MRSLHLCLSSLEPGSSLVTFSSHRMVPLICRPEKPCIFTSRNDLALCLLLTMQSGNTLAAKHLLTFTPSSKLPGLVSYSDPSTGLTPLAAASESGNAQLVKLLLKSGADCYGNDPDGVSPLMRACQKGHGDVVKVLLKEGEADAFAMTYKDGRTALMHAAAAGSVPCIQALLKIAHADIRQSSEQTGTHPLLEAALYGHFNAVKALLAAKAKANQTDKAGNTAVLLAARCVDLCVWCVVPVAISARLAPRHTRTSSGIASV